MTNGHRDHQGNDDDWSWPAPPRRPAAQSASAACSMAATGSQKPPPPSDHLAAPAKRKRWPIRPQLGGPHFVAAVASALVQHFCADEAGPCSSCTINAWARHHASGGCGCRSLGASHGSQPARQLLHGCRSACRGTAGVSILAQHGRLVEADVALLRDFGRADRLLCHRSCSTELEADAQLELAHLARRVQAPTSRLRAVPAARPATRRRLVRGTRQHLNLPPDAMLRWSSLPSVAIVGSAHKDAVERKSGAWRSWKPQADKWAEATSSNRRRESFSYDDVHQYGPAPPPLFGWRAVRRGEEGLAGQRRSCSISAGRRGWHMDRAAQLAVDLQHQLDLVLPPARRRRPGPGRIQQSP